MLLQLNICSLVEIETVLALVRPPATVHPPVLSVKTPSRQKRSIGTQSPFHDSSSCVVKSRLIKKKKKCLCDKVKTIWLRAWPRLPAADGACCSRTLMLPKEEGKDKTHVNKHPFSRSLWILTKNTILGAKLFHYYFSPPPLVYL